MAVTVVGAVLIGSVLSASPSLADEEETSWDGPKATSELNEVELPSPGGNKNSSKGDGSALSDALDEALATDEPVEVEELQTSTETVVANPDGTVTTEVAQAPVRVKQDGDWVDIDPSLEESGDRVAPVATPGDVSFSGDGDGSLARVELGGEAVSIGLPGLDLDAPTIDGAVATYDIAEPAASGAPDPSASPRESPAPSATSTETADAAPAESVQVAVKSRGFAAHVILDEAPVAAPEYVFELRTGALVPSLTDGVLTLSDADGKAVAQSLPLRMWDAQVDAAGDPTNVADVDATLKQAGEVWELTLSPSMDFLTAAATQYPVTVDPDISPVGLRGDSMFRSGADANTFFGNESRIDVGWDNGMVNYGFFGFAYNNFLGATVTKAELSLHQYYAPTCTARQVNVYSMTSGDGSQKRWSNQPTHLDDDARFAASRSFNSGGGTGCPRAREAIDVTAIVSGWAGAQIGTHTLPGNQVHNNRQAFIVRAQNETNGGGYKRFCSQEWSSNLPGCNNANVVPRLSVTVEPEIGEQGWYSMTERQLDERTTLKVNNKNANLFIATQDLNVKGIGMDLTLNRTYNSQSLETGPMGPGWSLDVGPDVWLEKRSQWRYNLHAPGGTVLGSFVRKRADHSTTAEKEQYDMFIAPLGGVGAELKQTNDGFVLTYRKSQQKFAFNEVNADGDAFMTAVKDRSDNTIDVAYDGTAGSKPKIKEIVDTVGRKLLPTYTGNVITKWATQDVGDVTARQWLYTYSGGNLASAADALGAVTNYTYKTDPNGPDLLTSIVAPANQSGARPTTEIGYAEPVAGDVVNTSRRVGSVGYRFGDGQDDLYRYTWKLHSSRVGACDGKGDLSTEVKDPRGNTTTYCYTQRAVTTGDAKTWVYDARGKARSQDYNADNQPLNSTAPTGQGAGGSSATAEYKNINDQMTSFTAAKSDGASGGDRTSMVYGGAASKPGGNYLPDVVSDGGDDCNKYMYDDAGRTMTTFSGLNPSRTNGEVTGCNTTATSKRSERRYNGNGTLKESWDANTDNDPDDSQKTIYTYWADGDTGLQPGWKGQVKTIRKPGGDCSTGSSRRLCTSFTYDGASRVKTMIDGRGQKTRYFYDKNDRTTVTHFNNDQSQICPAAGLSCIGYIYDAAGNLVTRDDQGGRSDYTYDRLNRQLTQKQPAGALGHDNLAYVYDSANNLIGYSQTLNLQPADVTTYTYNVANQPETVTSAVGTFDMTIDDDGRISEVEFPNPNNATGLKSKYTYTRSGKPKDFTWTNGNDGQLAKWDYDYKTDTGKDTPQLRKRTLEVVGNDPREGETEYKYNDDQRLESAKRTNSTDPYNYEYTYDKVGNILSEKIGSTTTHHGYNRAGERCWTGPNTGTQLDTTCPTSPSGATTFNHDAAGNNTGTASDPVNYNEKSQVSRISNTDQSYWGPGNDTRYVRGTERQISGQMGMTATSGDIGILYYTRSPDGTVLAVRSGSSSAFYVTEPNGHVAYMTDVNGATIGGYEYSPYGKTTVIGNVAFNPIRYLGAYQEPANSNGDQIYKLGARFYGTSGAFTQPDALSGGLGDPRTMTAYNYAGGDPINQQDASGYSFGELVGDAVGITIGAIGIATFCVTTGPIGCAVGGAASGVVGAGIGTAVTASIDGTTPEENREALGVNLATGALGGFIGPAATVGIRSLIRGAV